jgi:hypothetical protein
VVVVAFIRVLLVPADQAVELEVIQVAVEQQEPQR